MGHNLLGILVTFAFVFIVLVLSAIAGKKVDNEVSRKIVHIGVANCWWISMYFFDSPVSASIPPVFFIFFNFFSARHNIVKSMERGQEKGGAGYGTVYYPVSLLVLSVLCFSGLAPLYIGAVAVSCMGYGDGFAALIGRKFGKHKVNLKTGAQKSVEGCATMFVISFASSTAILSYENIANAIIISFLIALFGTFTELFTPDGYDNLTVPLGIAFFTMILMGVMS